MEIKTVIYPEQCKQYHEAMARGDMFTAHIFYLPPIYLPWHFIEMQMNIQQREAGLRCEMDRIENMPPELLKLETELIIKNLRK